MLVVPFILVVESQSLVWKVWGWEPVGGLKEERVISAEGMYVKSQNFSVPKQIERAHTGQGEKLIQLFPHLYLGPLFGWRCVHLCTIYSKIGVEVRVGPLGWLRSATIM